MTTDTYAAAADTASVLDDGYLPASYNTPEPELSEQVEDDASEREPIRRRKSGGRRGGVRRAVERALVVSALDKATISLLAQTLDVDLDKSGGDGVADVAIASLEASGDARSTLSLLVQMIDADDMEAASIATGLALEKTALKRIWTALRTLDDSLSVGPPSRPSQAGLALARSARKLGAAKQKTLSKALEVLG